MQQVYLKRMTKQDITKSVTICTESVDRFWGISRENANEYTPIRICSVKNMEYFPEGITIHKGYQGIKDWRITGAEFKKLYEDENAAKHDIMCVVKNNNNDFILSIIKKNTPEYNALIALLKPDDNYAIIDVDDDKQEDNEEEDHNDNDIEKYSLQCIFYGAPGTSKSFTVNEKTSGKDVIRTTFHPDSDYSTFVGAYKPTTDKLAIYDEAGRNIELEGQKLYKEQIIYSFVPQAFLKAYINAWKIWQKGEKQFLVIEEINRGNCAQIFGDLFQLLDRNDDGYSDYPVTTDEDMKKLLQKELSKISFTEQEKSKINKNYKIENAIDKVLEGELLLLPNNLYIWATMNTSDQSLFPIDSAFKRRWNWVYMPISDAGKKWNIRINGKNYNWWNFIEKINEKIGKTTSSEDKKLGYFFCKANNDGIITAERFVGKVLFYLWNDVFKDYEFNDDIFNDEKADDGTVRKLSFDKFYTAEGKNSTIVENKVELFLNNLGVIYTIVEKKNDEKGAIADVGDEGNKEEIV